MIVTTIRKAGEYLRLFFLSFFVLVSFLCVLFSLCSFLCLSFFLSFTTAVSGSLALRMLCLPYSLRWHGIALSTPLTALRCTAVVSLCRSFVITEPVSPDDLGRSISTHQHAYGVRAGCRRVERKLLNNVKNKHAQAALQFYRRTW